MNDNPPEPPYDELGRLVVRFADLDFGARLLTWKLIGGTRSRAFVVTRSLTTGRLAGMMKELAEVRRGEGMPDAIVERLLDAAAELTELTSRRNHAVHGWWIPGLDPENDEPTTLVFRSNDWQQGFLGLRRSAETDPAGHEKFEMSIEVRSGSSGSPLSPADLVELTARVDAAVVLLADLIPELPTG